MVNNGLLIGTRKGLVIAQQGTSGGWTLVDDHFLGIPVSLTYVDPSTGAWWAALDHGHWGIKLHRSFDFGKTWEELEAPKYPEGSMINADTDATLQYIWAIQSTGDGDGSVWIGTVPGGLFRYSAENVELVHSLWDHPTREQWFGGGMDHPGIHSIVVDPRNNQHIFVGISCGGVYKTEDGGDSWTIRNQGLIADFLPNPQAEVGHDPHLLVQVGSEPNVMWQQNHCGIFRSDDGATSWNDISQKGGPAHFGFAIAVDAHNDQRAWVAPAISDFIRAPVDKALCICRTDDGGSSWTALRNGLPQYSFDIVYRHALIASNDNVIFGTTTGNLFSSADGGDHWTEISTNLANVYSLSFF